MMYQMVMTISIVIYHLHLTIGMESFSLLMVSIVANVSPYCPCLFVVHLWPSGNSSLICVLVQQQHFMSLWRHSAENGDAGAQNNLGRCYYNGSGGVAKDYKQSFDWFNKSALQGNANAMNSIGLAYEKGTNG
jgi:hypothetical protein